MSDTAVVSTSATIQNAVAGLSLGLVAGTVIDFLLPTTASSSAAMLTFESFVQVALNGVFLSAAGPVLGNDPTCGYGLVVGLRYAQPQFERRLTTLGAALRSQLDQLGLRMMEPVPKEDTPKTE